MLEFEDLRKMLLSSRSASSENRKLTRRDYEYYHGNQLSDETKATLKKQGRPEVVSNYINLAVDGMVGVVQSNNTDPRAYPRNPQSTESADVVTKVLRYIADSTKFDTIKMNSTTDLVVGGVAAAVLKVVEYPNYKTGGTTIKILAEKVRWDEFFHDPYSRERDFKDATYLGLAKWMDADHVISKYPSIGEAARALVENTQGGIGLEDEDNNELRIWVDTARKRLLVVEMYYWTPDQYGLPKWRRAIFCQAGVIEDEEVPLVDDTGHTVCPLVAVSCRVDEENNRYGLVRNMISDQNEINSRRSRALHLANSRQTYRQNENAPPVDKELVRREAARPDGVLPDGYGPVPTSDMAQGNLMLMQDAVNHLNRSAPSAAVLGRTSEAISGRAKLIDQNAGMMELGPTFYALSSLETEMYRRFWWAAQLYWTDQRIINVTGEEDAVEHIMINEPVVEMMPQPIMTVMPGPDGNPVEVPMISPLTGQPVMEMKAQVVDYKNRLADLEVDIQVEATPNNVNLETETFNAVMDLLRSGIPINDPRWDLAIELAPLPNKTRVKTVLKAAKEAAEAAIQAQQAAQMEAMAAEQQVKTAETESVIQRNLARAAEDSASAQLKMNEAETQQINRNLMGLINPVFRGV